ncbi:MAG: ATP-binding protein, partial [Acidobacteria bacterium]|nr:ATP-binding protein [Acidobacteriota bacterium]
RDSLAGRISTIETGVFSLTEIGPLHGLETPKPFLPANGLSAIADKAFWTDLREHGRRHADFRTAAFRHYSERGCYPVVHKRKDVDWAELADLLRETVIRRVIQHDLLNGEGRRRDSALLEGLLQLTCRYAGIAPAVSELAEQVGLSLSVPIDGRRVMRYLNLLADTLLVRLVPPLDVRLRKNRGGPKLCLADHALRACWLQEQVPLSPPELTTQAGHLAESVFGSAACTIAGLDVAHLPARGADREVDFVLTVGVQRVPVEIKYQRRIDPHRDTVGLRSFLEKTVNNAAFGVLITQDAAGVLDDPRIVSLPLSTFLLLR